MDAYFIVTPDFLPAWAIPLAYTSQLGNLRCLLTAYVYGQLHMLCTFKSFHTGHCHIAGEFLRHKKNMSF